MDQSLESFFGYPDDNTLKVEVTEPVKLGYLIRNAFSFHDALDYHNELAKLPWLVQEVIVAGQAFLPMRETLAFADNEAVCDFSLKSYVGLYYNNIFKRLRNEIQEIIHNNITEISTIPSMNYCWGNRYRTGKDGIGKHKDDEKYLDLTEPIISVSFGKHRFFDIYREQQRVERTELGHGDIFIMMPGFQQAYYHALPRQLKVKDPRINLTFRCIATTKN